MHRSFHKIARLLLVGVVALTLSQATFGASVLGEWKLVEQSYGKGTANTVRADEPALHLAFARQGANVRGTLRMGTLQVSEYEWPRVVRDDSREISVLEKTLSENEDSIVARYRVEPSPGDDLVLFITESYRLSEDGSSLVGTVLVEFNRHGEDRGSYILHRRFEREAQ